MNRSSSHHALLVPVLVDDAEVAAPIPEVAAAHRRAAQGELERDLLERLRHRREGHGASIVRLLSMLPTK
jgi:hypothetical protein